MLLIFEYSDFGLIYISLYLLNFPCLGPFGNKPIFFLNESNCLPSFELSVQKGPESAVFLLSYVYIIMVKRVRSRGSLCSSRPGSTLY